VKATVLTSVLPSPGAGQAYSFTPSRTDIVKLLSVRALLTTGAEAGARYAYLQLADRNGLVYAQLPSNVAVAEALVSAYTWSQSVSHVETELSKSSGLASSSLPDYWLMPGDVMTLAVAGIKPVDAWTLGVVRFLACNEWENLVLEERIALAVGL
jgi:hypothetical protein